jgi:hypothetical protein
MWAFIRLVFSDGTRLAAPINPVNTPEECRCPEVLGKLPPLRLGIWNSGQSVEALCNVRVTNRDGGCDDVGVME